MTLGAARRGMPAGGGALGGGGKKKKKRYPIPVSLTLRNLFVPPPPREKDQDGRSSELLRKGSSATDVNSADDDDTDIDVYVAPPPRLLFRPRIEIVREPEDDSISSSEFEQGAAPHSSQGCGTAAHPANDEYGDSRGVIYSSAQSSVSLHPHWDHLDERVRLFDVKGSETSRGAATADAGDEGDVGADDWDGLYRTLRVRIVVDGPLPLPRAAVGKRDDIGDGEQSIGRDNFHEKPIILADMPLHPTLLKRLPRDSSSSAGGLSSGDIPRSLPPNAALLRHSDGSTRVVPDLFRLLLEKGVVLEDDPRTLDDDAKEELEEEKRRERRFDDDIFAVLDSKAASKTPSRGDKKEKEAAMRASPSQLLGERTSLAVTLAPIPRRTSAERKAAVGDAAAAAASAFSDDSLFDLLGGGGGNSVESTISSPKRPANGEFRAISAGAFDFPVQEQQGPVEENTFSALDADFAPPQEESPERIELKSALIESPAVDKEEGNPQDTLPLESEMKVNDLRAEVEWLRLLLREEEAGLKEDQAILQAELEDMASIIKETKRLEVETQLIRRNAKKETDKLARSEFALECRRIKLLRDLRSIYPIRRLPQNVYTIRDIHLPSDLHSLNASDALISAALGFACHLIFMAAKYLSVPLRYRLICNSSRSAVQDDGRGVCPLFKERGVVEREHFDRAVELLVRDAECLLKSRGLAYDPQSHLLAKVNLLFEATTEVSSARGVSNGGVEN